MNERKVAIIDGKKFELGTREFFQAIGRKGGRNGHTGGFASNPELAKIAGSKGGKISKRRKVKKS